MLADEEDDEFSNLPDDFEGVDFDSIQALAPAATDSATPATNKLPMEKSGSDTSSPRYSCDDHFDAAFLAEIDALENSLQPAGEFCLLRVRKCSIDVVFSTRQGIYTSTSVQHSRFFSGLIPLLMTRSFSISHSTVSQKHIPLPRAKHPVPACLICRQMLVLPHDPRKPRTLLKVKPFNDTHPTSAASQAPRLNPLLRRARWEARVSAKS